MTRKLAFLHIPKCGGVSVEAAAKKWFSPAEVAPYYFPYEYKHADPSALRAYGLIIGHYDFDILQALGPSYVKGVVFRDPLSLLVSLYNHAATRPRHALYAAISNGELGFERFCRTVGGAKNIISKYLLGREEYSTICEKASGAELITSGVEIATRNLCRFDCMGLTSKMAEFADQLSGQLGVRFGPVARLNHARRDVISLESLTGKERLAFEETNAMDIAVYESIERCYEVGARGTNGSHYSTS
jgi:hypothetical protein